MSLSAAILADRRARADFLPFCPLCSFVSVADIPDILHGPTHREFRGSFKVDRCCSLSSTDEVFDSPADVAQWWRARRLEPLKDIALNSRRLNTLQKLAAKNLEPIE